MRIEEKWALIQYVEDGDKTYTLWVDDYDVAEYDHYPTEEEVTRDIYTFEKGVQVHDSGVA